MGPRASFSAPITPVIPTGLPGPSAGWRGPGAEYGAGGHAVCKYRGHLRVQQVRSGWDGQGPGWWTRGGGLGPNPNLGAPQGLVQAHPWGVETLGRDYDGEEGPRVVEE